MNMILSAYIYISSRSGTYGMYGQYGASSNHLDGSVSTLRPVHGLIWDLVRPRAAEADPGGPPPRNTADPAAGLGLLLLHGLARGSLFSCDEECGGEQESKHEETLRGRHLQATKVIN